MPGEITGKAGGADNRDVPIACPRDFLRKAAVEGHAGGMAHRKQSLHTETGTRLGTFSGTAGTRGYQAGGSWRNLRHSAMSDHVSGCRVLRASGIATISSRTIQKNPAGSRVGNPPCIEKYRA